MIFEVSKDVLLESISTVIGVVERKQSMPILSHLLVEGTSSGVKLVGTDLEVEIEALMQIESSSEMKTTLPGRKLFDICRSLPDGCNVRLSIDNQKIKIESGKSKFSLVPLEPSEFPRMNQVQSDQGYKIKSDALLNLLENTSFSMANQDVRHYLNGVMISIHENQMIAVATDGHRLAVSKETIKNEEANNISIIIPRKAVNELLKIVKSGENIIFSPEKNQICVKTGSISITSKLIDGAFPDYEKVIPKDPKTTFIADRKNLKDTLQRVAILSNEKYRGIRINIDKNQILIKANNPEQEEAEEVLEVDYNGEPMEVGFNVSYLIEILNAIEDENIVFSLVDSSSSCLIHGNNDPKSKYVVMPMRL